MQSVERPATFGALLRAHRLVAGLTQAELAEAAGLSERGIQRLETGRTRPYRATIEQLVGALGLADDLEGELNAAAARMRRPRGTPAAQAPSGSRPALHLLPVEQPAGTVTEARRPAVPLPLTRLIGRDRDVDAIREALVGNRLVTLTGTGGIGKTRLALEVLRSRETSYADGVRLVELAALADEHLVPRAVAASLALDESPHRPLVERLVDNLISKNLLLVLDNCEHLVDACATLVDALLRACPRLHVLATSREALGVSGEVVWRVSPLAVPPDDAEPLSSRSDASAAVQLFVDRAVAALPGFALTEQNTSAIARICRRLDGIPLALELAAALVPALTVEQMGVCLDDAVGLLTAGNRTAPARHRALRATLDWSYDLLTEPERVVLRRAAVFAGGWSLAAAEWVCAGDQPASTAHAGPGRSPPAVATSDVLHLLVRLLAKSLVHAEREVSGPAPEARYRLLETVRQYATEQLRAVGEEELVRRRHSAWCASLSEQAEPGLHGADQVAWLVRLDREYDNIRAALAWCLEHDPPLGLHIAASLWQFWRMRLFLTEGRQWLEQLLAGAPAPTLARARGLTAAGTLANWQLDVVVARDRYEAALELARTLDDRALVGRIMRELGSLTAVRFGDHRRAWALFDEGLALSRAADDHGNVAVNLMQQGRLAAVEGSYRRAQRLLDESVILLSQVGDRWQLAIALEDAGGVALIVGQPERATSLFDEALAIGQGVEAAGLGTLHRRYHLGTVAYWRGDAPTALAWYEQGLAMTRAKEHIAGMTDNLIGLGRAVLLQGDVMRASELFTESLRLSEARGDLSGAALALHGLGLVDWHMGDAARAFTHLRESLRLRRDLDDHLGMAECLEALGAVAAGCATSREAAERAVGWLGAADALRERLGAPRPPVDQPTYTAAMSVSRTWLDHPASAAAAGASEPLAAVLADLLPAQSIG